MKVENKLTANTPIYNFTDEQVKQAMKTIEGDSPLEYARQLHNAMTEYIIFHDLVDPTVKSTYSAMDKHLNFHLKLIEMVMSNE